MVLAFGALPHDRNKDTVGGSSSNNRSSSEVKMSSTPTLRSLKPGGFWQHVQKVSAAALASGALVPLTTKASLLPCHGVDFQIRILERIAKKEKAKTSKPKNFNPFLPPEPELAVCEVEPHHLCLLNKFNVFDNHLLLVTKEYQPQMRRLDHSDMVALCSLMEQRHFLAFYNGGPKAGASQHHKHMQVIPLPLTDEEEEPTVPLEAVMTPEDGLVQQSLPFLHRVHWFITDGQEDEAGDQVAHDHAHMRANGNGNADADADADAEREGEEELRRKRTPGRAYQQWRDPDAVHSAYLSLMSDLDRLRHDNPHMTKPYNFIMTRRWMMVVPRSADGMNGVECNGIAFTGAMLVRSPDDAEWLKEYGIFRLMAHLCNEPVVSSDDEEDDDDEEINGEGQNNDGGGGSKKREEGHAQGVSDSNTGSSATSRNGDASRSNIVPNPSTAGHQSNASVSTSSADPSSE